MKFILTFDVSIVMRYYDSNIRLERNWEDLGGNKIEQAAWWDSAYRQAKAQDDQQFDQSEWSDDPAL